VSKRRLVTTGDLTTPSAKGLADSGVAGHPSHEASQIMFMETALSNTHSTRLRRRRFGALRASPNSHLDHALSDLVLVNVNRRPRLTSRGCGQKLGLPRGSSCTRTKTGFEPSSSTSGSANASVARLPDTGCGVLRRRGGCDAESGMSRVTEKSPELLPASPADLLWA